MKNIIEEIKSLQEKRLELCDLYYDLKHSLHIRKRLLTNIDDIDSRLENLEAFLDNENVF